MNVFSEVLTKSTPSLVSVIDFIVIFLLVRFSWLRRISYLTDTSVFFGSIEILNIPDKPGAKFPWFYMVIILNFYFFYSKFFVYTI